MNKKKHLSLPLFYKGKIRLPIIIQDEKKLNKITLKNKENRKEHSKSLNKNITKIKQDWINISLSRKEENLPNIPLSVPLLLKCDPDTFDIDKLKSLGLEVVSEYDDGFVIVATENSNLEKLSQKIDSFGAGGKNLGTIASIHEVIHEESHDNRLKRILDEELYHKWNRISDDNLYVLEVGIECIGVNRLSKKPVKKPKETSENYESRFKKWVDRFKEGCENLDQLRLNRETEFEEFLKGYGENLESYKNINGTEYAGIDDSFTAKIKINGKGLKELALIYPFVFEINCPETIEIIDNTTVNGIEPDIEIEFLPPNKNSPKVCIIDSGIQEGHKYLALAIDSPNSFNFIDNTTSAPDEVNGGGHGTRVAGALLFPNGIPKEGDYQFPCWIQNAKVLDSNNQMPIKLFPPLLIKKIIDKYYQKANTRLYNQSINSYFPSRLKRVSAWAAQIDDLSYENDILLVQSAGNVDAIHPITKGINQHLREGKKYPDYLLEDSCRISNPAQSFQALTVGSICVDTFEDADIKSLGLKDEPSSFSRTGPGVFGLLKPEVVEYGGSDADSKSNPGNIINHPNLSLELVRRSPEGPAVAKDATGTSFSAPKVTFIASELQKNFPTLSTLLYRGLIVQSARWPVWAENFDPNKYTNVLRHIGYGIPNLDRALHSSENRVTLITSSDIVIYPQELHIYNIPIPKKIRNVGDEYDIRIEVTLSYKAKPRRTRKKLKKYLSSWVDWISSKSGQTPQSFIEEQRLDGKKNSTGNEKPLNWRLRERNDWGMIKDFSRSTGTVQKDWAIVKPYDLTEGFCIGVKGHKGWDGENARFPAKYSLIVTFEVTNSEVEIYEEIRSEIEIEVEQKLEVEVGSEIGF